MSSGSRLFWPYRRTLGLIKLVFKLILMACLITTLQLPQLSSPLLNTRVEAAEKRPISRFFTSDRMEKLPGDSETIKTDSKDLTGTEGDPPFQQPVNDLHYSTGSSSLSDLSYGDINNDGVINVLDAVLVMRHVLDLKKLTEDQASAADVNLDGRINVLDVTLIMQKALGLIDDFLTPPKPVIYPGQKLVIPLPKEDDLKASRVVHSGTVPGSKKQMALTFDSGWLYEQTIPLLNVLDQYEVTATFFPRALWVKDHPGLAQEILKRGHTLGNHSLTHPHMTGLTRAEMEHEIQESTRIIKQVTGIRPYLFRPPYGEYDQRLLEVLAENGYPYTVMWTIDTIDWAAGTTRIVGGKQVYIDTDFIVNRVLQNAGDNKIVLMHIGRPETVEALPRIIKGLRDKGYTFNTVDKMLPVPKTGPITHTVKKGETLESISQHYGVPVQKIIEANRQLGGTD